ncbi:hypothetical protein BJ684DRAFT_15936 [Piptocephalis cylindrospora]|uniref:BAG domain-containing protein n=1 Tax=Piptocephalis cylindrospora TaxID=1907219 RepID=A0A4P9Y454_9FUNG|nr:hypothetical protein BJ684DRAFT_15936 [Piptocephalis cylindrospora]|eukprot:RKP13685.1 hypothetical protein BJ684DRAFT_15936 [Piptocephalis cylindrospora]
MPLIVLQPSFPPHHLVFRRNPGWPIHTDTIRDDLIPYGKRYRTNRWGNAVAMNHAALQIPHHGYPYYQQQWEEERQARIHHLQRYFEHQESMYREDMDRHRLLALVLQQQEGIKSPVCYPRSSGIPSSFLAPSYYQVAHNTSLQRRTPMGIQEASIILTRSAKAFLLRRRLAHALPSLFLLSKISRESKRIEKDIDDWRRSLQMGDNESPSSVPRNFLQVKEEELLQLLMRLDQVEDRQVREMRKTLVIRIQEILEQLDQGKDDISTEAEK